MSDRTALTDIVPPVRQEPQHNQSISSRRSRYFLATSVTKKLDHNTLPNLRQQLAETTGIFKGKERKALKKQIQQTEVELAEKLDKIPDILKDDGYPDVQAFMKTYRKAEAIVTQYNQDLAEWEQAVKNGQKPALRSYIYMSIRKHPARFLRLAGCSYKYLNLLLIFLRNY